MFIIFFMNYNRIQIEISFIYLYIYILQRNAEVNPKEQGEFFAKMKGLQKLQMTIFVEINEVSHQRRKPVKENHARQSEMKYIIITNISKISINNFYTDMARRAQLIADYNIKFTTMYVQPEWRTSEWSNCTALSPEGGNNGNSTSEEEDEEEGSGGKTNM